MSLTVVRCLGVAAALVAVGTGCASSDSKDLASSGPADEAFSGSNAPTVGPADTLRVNVLPSTSQYSDGEWRALPQTVTTIDRSALAASLAELRISAPIELVGHVTGTATTPWRDAILPSTSGPVDALLSWTRTNAIEAALAGTDVDGAFSTWVIPGGERYQVAVVPTDPMIPPLVGFELFSTDSRDFDIELGVGVSVWGTVTLDDVPSTEGHRVRAVDPNGVTTAETLVDADGWYQLRLPPGVWSIESLGRDHGLDPVLTEELATIGAEGLRVDFDYGSLSLVSLRGRVTANGANLDFANVRFVSTALAGLANASLTVDAVTSGGNVSATLSAGTYDVEVWPDPDGNAFAPARLEGVIVVDGAVMPDIDLALPVVTEFLAARVDDNSVLPATAVTCIEVGFGGRVFTGETGQDGLLMLDLPPTPLDCTFLPPSDSGLPRKRIPSLVPAAAVPVPMDTGTQMTGSVLLDGVPESFAVVEIRDGEDNSLIAASVTSEDGSFSVLVPLE